MWSSIYSGTAEIGQVYTIVGAVIATIIGVVVIVAGYKGYGSKDPNEDGPHDPNEPVPVRQINWPLIMLGLVMIAISWGWVWINREFKPVAALSGAAAIGDIARSIL